MKWIKNLLPHISLMLSAVIITLYILDIYNPVRGFLSRDLSKMLLLVFAILSAIVSILLVRYNRRED